MLIKLSSNVVSYSLDKYYATKKNPIIDVPDDIAEYLISTGNFSVVNENITEKKQENIGVITTDEVPTVVDIEKSDNDSISNIGKMTVAQLDELAEQVGYKYEGKLNKEQKIAALSEYLNTVE